MISENDFRSLFSYWNGKLNLPCLRCYKDNRIRYVAKVDICSKHKYYTLTYNLKFLQEMGTSDIFNVIFHELGHIKYETSYEKFCRSYSYYE